VVDDPVGFEHPSSSSPRVHPQLLVEQDVLADQARVLRVSVCRSISVRSSSSSSPSTGLVR
jgi:hypothetical protein